MSNYEKVEVGSWDNLPQQVFEKPPLKAKGKRFVGKQAQTSGCELSFNHLEQGKGYPFFHKHNENEEIYVVVRGEGQMQVDGEVIPIVEGSVVKVAPAGVRSIRAADDSSLDYLCFQAKADSLVSYDVGDGAIVPGEVVWP